MLEFHTALELSLFSLLLSLVGVFQYKLVEAFITPTFVISISDIPLYMLINWDDERNDLRQYRTQISTPSLSERHLLFL